MYRVSPNNNTRRRDLLITFHNGKQCDCSLSTGSNQSKSLSHALSLNTNSRKATAKLTYGAAIVCCTQKDHEINCLQRTLWPQDVSHNAACAICEQKPRQTNQYFHHCPNMIAKAPKSCQYLLCEACFSNKFGNRRRRRLPVAYS